MTSESSGLSLFDDKGKARAKLHFSADDLMFGLSDEKEDPRAMIYVAQNKTAFSLRHSRNGMPSIEQFVTKNA
jgi:hypothetical protein